MYGYDSIEELRDIPSERRYTPESYAEVVARRQLTERGEPVPDTYEVSIVRRYGEVRHLAVFRKEVVWDGETRYQLLYQDVTEEKRAKEALMQSREELRNLAAHARSAIEEERTSIARDIHDELGQSLAALKMELARLTTELPAGGQPLVARTETMNRLANEAIQTVRETSTRLRPGVLDDLGIAAALEWQAGEFHKRTGIMCRVSMAPEDAAIDRDVATAVFRIFQEALTNVLRHASATRVSASLRREGDDLILRVRDNGKGITSKQIASSRSLGLIGMRERAYFIGGELDIRRARNGGTELVLKAPLHVGVGSID